MIKQIYHGSNHIIDKPVFGYGKSYNDYGLGFYCTESIEMAKEWGVGLNRDGYANIYELETNNLDILDINDSNHCILHWLTILLNNRHFEVSSVLAKDAKDYLLQYFSVDYQSKDVLTGYRADDSYFSFSLDFLNGAISYRQLCQAMFLGKLGQQIVLKSEKAFSQLKYIGFEIADSHEWYEKKRARDKKARDDYFNRTYNSRKKGDLYIAQILDEEIKPDDERLR